MYISESSRAPPLRSSFLSRPICKLRINHYIRIGVRGDSSELPLFIHLHPALVRNVLNENRLAGFLDHCNLRKQ